MGGTKLRLRGDSSSNVSKVEREISTEKWTDKNAVLFSRTPGKTLPHQRVQGN